MKHSLFHGVVLILTRLPLYNLETFNYQVYTLFHDMK
jgi:hypothetical protein